MIQANELRIGNLVIFKGRVKPVKLDSELIHAIDKHDSKFYEPIPLTPEILEKCGFKEKEYHLGGTRFHSKWQDEKSKTDDNDFITIDEEGVGYCINEFCMGHDGRVVVKLKYLHELQNLVFVLHKEELPFAP